MINLQNYKSVSNESYIFVEDVIKYGINFKEMLSSTNLFKSIQTNFHINIDTFIAVIESLGIEQRELFDFCTHKGVNNILVAENGVYNEKYDEIAKRFIKTYFSVYLCEHPYSSTLYSRIAEKLMIMYFAQLFNYPTFNIEIPLPKLELNYNKPMRDILFGYSNLTYQDFRDIQKGKTTKNKSKFHLYNDFIVLDLETINVHNKTYNYALIIPYDVLHTKDWSLVENFKVHSIIKRNANDKLGRDKSNWFEGKQIDSPYWDNPIIDELKELIKSL